MQPPPETSPTSLGLLISGSTALKGVVEASSLNNKDKVSRAVEQTKTFHQCRTRMVLRKPLEILKQGMMRLPRMPCTKRSQEVPVLFREPYVHDGHRPPHQPWHHYLLSLFQIHNEVMNAWTHLIPFSILLYNVFTRTGELDFSADHTSWALLLLGFGGCSFLFLSFAAHLFQSHSEHAHYMCFILDYVGIAFYGFTAGLAQFSICSDPWFSRVFKPVFFPPVGSERLLHVYLLFVREGQVQPTLSTHALGTADKRHWQHVCSVHVSRPARVMMDHARNSMDTVSWMHVAHTAFFMTGVFFYTSNVPHRFQPGMFDIVGHGHQLFHVAMATMAIIQFETVFRDLQSGRHFLLSRPSVTSITVQATVVLLCCVVSTLTMAAKVRRKLKNKVQ
ncbi:LOW QUALITY PROTEIN: membrane progestin receptor beta-like [Branchiostoma floridae]|uniref:LOW QUALITY PROTEIN: membrane progestin receptor beta-like n=1 Tax=Branchiostoma floridae TaxID=7739 RepID=A0A9J7KQL3_BRAFL|nr:LOW QUALITY PROTEIN: membrane progestin receptor beta-like [Branchiostoma floridae]